MSTLRANTLSNSAGTGSPDITGGELSRARFNLNGTGTIAARDDFNIASYVDNGTGDYTSNFATAFPNSNYAPASCQSLELGAADSSSGSGSGTRLRTMSTSALRYVAVVGAANDWLVMTMSIHGDRP